MQTQTIIAQYQKAISVLELIERANNIIAESEKYAKATKKYLQPVVDYHVKQVQRYTRIAERLQAYYIRLKYTISTTSVNIAYTSDLMLPY